MDIIPNPMFAAVMTVPFIVSAIALYGLLFKPYFEYLEGREQAIGGARHDAATLAREAEQKLSQVEASLAEARAKGEALRLSHREKGLQYERSVVEDARSAAERTLGEALKGIAQEAEAAASAMNQTAHELSGDIASRVLGREA